MQNLTKSQQARLAIRIFQTTVDALALRGYYRASGKSGQPLEDALKIISPEIYGSMTDPRVIELKGLEYVLDRLPVGIEECSRIILTAQEELENTSFEKILPLKRRRISYRVNEKEMCFVITRGLSEIYDILTHITFLNIESKKIKELMFDEEKNLTPEWAELENIVKQHIELKGSDLDKAIWNLSIILGRTFQETKETYEYLEKSKIENNSNKGLFSIIYNLGVRAKGEEIARENMLLVYLTPSLKEMIGHHKYCDKWVNNIYEQLCRQNLQNRTVHIISANMHSIMNILYAYSALENNNKVKNINDFYSFFDDVKEYKDIVVKHAQNNGLTFIEDKSGMHIDYQIIDTSYLSSINFHPDLKFNINNDKTDNSPVLFVMDYAFGTQAFDALDNLLDILHDEKLDSIFNVSSISIMGKAGILTGQKGDIMIASAHVLEGTPHNYIIDNDLKEEDFDSTVNVYKGPIVTVLGTSLQNQEVLKKFMESSWHAVGLEMEGGHYQRAINAGIIKGKIANNIKVRYAYYASDNPLISGQTLASGSMGKEGIKPTYMITKIILEKIFK